MSWDTLDKVSFILNAILYGVIVYCIVCHSGIVLGVPHIFGQGGISEFKGAFIINKCHRCTAKIIGSKN